MAVKRCINDMLIPHFKGEIEKKLLEEAKLCVAEKCAESLAKKIEFMGFKPLDLHEEEDLEFTRLACYFFYSGNVNNFRVKYV